MILNSVIRIDTDYFSNQGELDRVLDIEFDRIRYEMGELFYKSVNQV